MKKTTTELTEIKKKNKVLEIVDKIGRRNLMVACAVLLIGAAVVLNWVLFSGGDATGGYPGYDQPSGSISDNTGGDEVDADSNATYFSSAQIARQRARDEALEVLQAVVDNEESSEAAKQEASDSIAAIAAEIQMEADIESLITAKGFSQCVAVLNGDQASIIVETEELQAAQIAQINAIVYEQAGIVPAGVTIIKK